MNSTRKAHQCEHCSKGFASSHQLAQHARIHTGEKPYKCQYCDKRFKQLSHVQQHTRLHTGERPYKCPASECGRAFIQLSNLQQHMRNHVSAQEKLARSRDKSHFCSDCGKGFKAQANLLTHKCRHTVSPAISDRLIPRERCPMCQQSFSAKDALLEHLRGHHHNGDRVPHDSHSHKKPPLSSCPYCGKFYVNQTSLRKHILAHTEGEQPTANSSSHTFWSCCVCKSGFNSQNALLCHMEQMRTDPKHQFEAQIVLSCAAAERRAKEIAEHEMSGQNEQDGHGPESSSREHHSHHGSLAISSPNGARQSSHHNVQEHLGHVGSGL